MQSALVIYFVATIFAVVYGLPDLCVFKDYGGKAALCRRRDVGNTLDFIPLVSLHITYIDLRGQPLKQLPYNAFGNLSSQSSISKIRLEDCQISYVDAGALLNLHNLTNIDLSHNDIKEIDSKLFSDTKQIKFIYMGYNNIEILPNGLFQNLLQLEAVYLQHNLIRQVEWFSFKNTQSLRIIYLNNNEIQLMNMLFNNKFDNLTTLSLYGNPWNCNCELGPLYELVTQLNNLNLHELVCENPPTLHGRKWSDISRDEFVCHSGNVISTKDSFMTSTEPTTTTEQDDNVLVAVYNGSMSTKGLVMTSTEPTTNKNVLVTDYNETRCQQVGTGIPQSPVITWIQYTILGLVLVCVVAVIIGVVFVVRQSLAASNRRRHVLLPTIRRTKDPMRVVESGAVSENSDSGSNTDDDVDEELISIHHLIVSLC